MAGILGDTERGIDHVSECIAAYLRSAECDHELLIRYAEQLANGAVFKRLGYLAETRLEDTELVFQAHSNSVRQAPGRTAVATIA